MALLVTTPRENDPIMNSRTKQRYILATLDGSYPSGGYDLDLQAEIRWVNIDAIFFSDFGGYSATYDTDEKKLRILRGGAEVVEGTSFYDAENNIYAKLWIHVLKIENYFDPSGIRTKNLLQDGVVSVDAKSLNGITSDQLLRKDADDSMNESITTTIPSTSTLKVEGTQNIESGGAITVKSGATQTVEGTQKVSSGATVEIVGSTVVTYGNITSNNFNVSAGTHWNITGANVPTLTTLTGGTAGKRIIIWCKSGTVVIDETGNITLQNSSLLYLSPYDTVELIYEGSGWIQDKPMYSSNGSATVGTSGTLTVKGTTINSIASVITSGTPNVSSGTFFEVDGGIVPTISSISGGVAEKYIVITCISGSCTITHGASTIDLQADRDLILANGDNVSLIYKTDHWVQYDPAYKTNGSTTVGTGGTITLGGTYVKEAAGWITSDGHDVSSGTFWTVNGATVGSINSLTGGTEGKTITIQCVGSTVVIAHNGTSIDLQNDRSLILTSGAVVSLQYQSGVWVQLDSAYSPKGTQHVGDGGTITLDGGVIKGNETPITSDGQDVTGKSNLTLTAASPAQVTTLVTSDAGHEIEITGRIAAKQILDASNVGGGANINLPANVDITMDENDTITLRYNAATSKWDFIRINYVP